MKGKERQGKERKGKERKGKERKGKKSIMTTTKKKKKHDKYICELQSECGFVE